MATQNFTSTIEDIKKLGYWKVNFYPAEVNTALIPKVGDIREIVRNATIELRGWDYPHFPTETRDHQDCYVAGDKFEGWINWQQYREVWRMYQSGQFIHLFGLREDRLAEDNWLSEDHPYKQIKPGSVLEVIGTIYTITEIFAFLRNLVQAGIFQDKVVVELELHNTENRSLHISDFRRAPLFGDYRSRIKDIILPVNTYSAQDILENYLDLALDQTVNLFQQFNWTNPPIEVIKEDQKKLIERRL